MELLKAIVSWAACVIVLAAIPAYFAYRYLQEQRHPREALAENYLRSRLPDMTADQESLVRRAVDDDPLLAMFVVASAQRQNQSPWEPLARADDPSQMLSVPRRALEEGIAGKLGKQQAAGFVDATLQTWAILADADKVEADAYLDQTRQLSPEELPLAAKNPAYALMVSRIDPRYRADFRDHQDILTPLLVATASDQWNNLLAKFQQAEPRVVEIFNDPSMGRLYGTTYLLESDLVRELEGAGVALKQAIEFVGPNAAVIREFKKDHREWAAIVAKFCDTTADHEAAPGKKLSIFAWACADPAVFWLIAHDASVDGHEAAIVLQRYAGTDLPAVLLKYGKAPEMLRNAIDALLRFDNQMDADPRKRQAAAHMLSDYQDDVPFKDSLQTVGSVLVPAIFYGGSDALAQIRKNPPDLYKNVDENGKPKGTPFWTYIPGGNIAFVIREKVNGRTLAWGEIGWAAVDAVLLIPAGGEILMAGKGLLATDAAGEALVKVAGEAGSESLGEEIAIEGTGGMLVRETVAASSRIGAVVESRTLLARAGIKLVEGAEQSVTWAARLARLYPRASLSIAALSLAALFPAQAGKVARRVREVIVQAINGTAETLGNVIAAALGMVIDGMWDEIQSLSRRQPMLAPVYYLLFMALLFWIVVVPLYMLKVLLKPVYQFAVDIVGRPARLILTALRPAKDPTTTGTRSK